MHCLCDEKDIRIGIGQKKLPKIMGKGTNVVCIIYHQLPAG
jgi:hypothetical protein